MRLQEATVLMVDDEPELLELFSAWLEHEGCLVFTATNGVEALKVLEAEKIDALISDVYMPVMDGVALVRTAYERKILIPSIILVTGLRDLWPLESLGHGVYTVLDKPLKRKDLLLVLQNSLTEASFEIGASLVRNEGEFQPALLPTITRLL
jgi:CheY-like chemotaxis protein